MNKLVLLTSLISLAFTSSAIASGTTMTNEEFKRVVCNHVAQTEEVKVAISKAYSEIKTITTDGQKRTLKKFATGEYDVQNFCSNIQI